MSPIYVPGKLVFAKDPFKALTATGGDSVYDITIDGTRYRVHEFKTTGTSTFTVSALGTGLHPKLADSSANTIEYLVVGAGGSGSHGTSGLTYGGAGGGGRVLSGTLTLTTGSKSVTVGTGGAGVTGNANDGNDGGNSVFESFTAGGGKKGLANGNGGASGDSLFAGQVRVSITGGGGGGAGGNASGTTGGAGVTSSITGNSVGYGGGGGGSADTGIPPINGQGQDGGGNGGGLNSAPTNGAANRGGGGGSTRAENGNASGAGGSGIVIVRYAI